MSTSTAEICAPTDGLECPPPDARPPLLADLREALTEQWRYRDLLLQIVTRDLLLRYKQTSMGIAWAVLVPLLNTAIFSVVFMRVAPIDTPVPYPLFAYSGLVAWNFTASALRFATISLTANTTLVSKVYFPREIFPFAAVIVSLVDTSVAAALAGLVMAYYGIGVGPLALAVIPLLLVQLTLTAALALVLSMANLFYRDVKYLFDVVIIVWMFGSSVVYPAAAAGGALGRIMRLNPMSLIIDGYRAVLFDQQLPPVAPLALTAAGALALLVAAWVAFHRAEFSFAERI